jgi:MerR family copper efflux transcriptional regulator
LETGFPRSGKKGIRTPNDWNPFSNVWKRSVLYIPGFFEVGQELRIFGNADVDMIAMEHVDQGTPVVINTGGGHDEVYIGSMAIATRNANGYRSYDNRAVEELRFVHRAREVGFSVEECRQLVELHRDHGRRSAHVKSLVTEKCEQLQQRIEQLNNMVGVLQRMADQCSGDEGPDCAILDELGRDGDNHE